MSDELTHLDEAGRARMVDVGSKPATRREATAEGFVVMRPETLDLLSGGGDLPKGSAREALAVARVAGIMAAKKTGELIPLCHPLSIESVEVSFEPCPVESPQLSDGLSRLRVTAVARLTGRTGVEMEALMAVSVAALTIYDMAKAVDKQMRIEGVRLVSKSK